MVQTRSQAVEDRIRQIDSRDSAFNPSPVEYFTEDANRGLPPRKDLRDAVQSIESAPYVPDSYNRTNYVAPPSSSLFEFTARSGKMNTVLNGYIENVKFDDTTIEEILFNIGTPGNELNFVADRTLEALQKKISLDFSRVKLGEFLEYISRNYNLQFQIGEDLIWIVDGSAEENKFVEFRTYPLRHGFILPARFGQEKQVYSETFDKNKQTTTVVTSGEYDIFVNDGTPEKTSMEDAIEKFFVVVGGKYMIQKERNLILAQGTREQLEVLERIIEEYDVPLKQVLIEARFITVSEAAYLKLGALWETGRPEIREGQVPADQLGFGRDDVGRGLQETFHNILDRESLSITLEALDQQGESQILSAPRITVVNNLPARISDGKVQYYYEEYTTFASQSRETFVESLAPSGSPKEITSGVTLEVMASIGGDGETIYLALHPEVNQDVQLVPFVTVVGSSGDKFEIRLPEWRTQSLSTRAVVSSGQTVVMGGVLEREQSRFVDSVPILGKLPLIGPAFRRRTELDRPRYLFVFVTATLLSSSGEFIQVDRNSPDGVLPPLGP